MSHSSHSFNLPGGEMLTTMGATWFVSYMYYDCIDKNHLNWTRKGTKDKLIPVYNRSHSYHKLWLAEILKMNDSRLAMNTINLSPLEIKSMARELLEIK